MSKIGSEQEQIMYRRYIGLTNFINKRYELVKESLGLDFVELIEERKQSWKDYVETTFRWNLCRSTTDIHKNVVFCPSVSSEMLALFQEKAAMLGLTEEEEEEALHLAIVDFIKDRIDV